MEYSKWGNSAEIKTGERLVTGRRQIILGLAPLGALIFVIAAFLIAGPYLTPPLSAYNIPIERIDIERIVLEDHRIIVYAVNSGPSEATIAQVFVNDAIWYGEYSPQATVGRLGRVTITIPYEWVEGEPVKISLVTSNGFVFTRSIETSVLTPKASVAQVFSFAAIGAYVGIIPVFLGLAWLPFLSRLKTRWYNFLLSLTAGLLLFLAVDAMNEAFELSNRVPGPFQGIPLLILGLVVTFLGLEMISERALSSDSSKGAVKKTLLLAYLIALGIGLHNLGEGLLIGAAYALGELALGTFLILGFTIHNTTEGVAIAAPMAGRTPTSKHLIWLGLIAGAPTILGTWIGGFTYSDIWALLFLAVGVGAILQVVYEIMIFIANGKGPVKVLSESRNFYGLLVGFLIMYVTALLLA